MKGILLLIAAFLLWMVGGSIALLGGDVYASFAHPDGLTYWGFLWRHVVFLLPDTVILVLTLFVYVGSVIVSPYRKTMGFVVFIFGIYTLWTCYNGLGVGQSITIHIMNGVISTIAGLVGLFSTTDNIQPQKSQPNSSRVEIINEAEPQQEKPPLSREAKIKAFRNLQALIREAEQR